MTPSCKWPIIFPILGIWDSVGYLGFFPIGSFSDPHICAICAPIWGIIISLRFNVYNIFSSSPPPPSLLSHGFDYPNFTLNIVGHCFVKRLRTDLRCKFDNYDAAVDFNLSETANVSLYGIRGLTVPRLAQEFGLKFANEPLSRIIILEIGRNDLSS